MGILNKLREGFHTATDEFESKMPLTFACPECPNTIKRFEMVDHLKKEHGWSYWKATKYMVGK